jgi:hypothetical protein
MEIVYYMLHHLVRRFYLKNSSEKLFILAMWGFHDHSLSMRKALNDTLITSKPNNSLYRRWRWAQSVQNKKVK